MRLTSWVAPFFVAGLATIACEKDASKQGAAPGASSLAASKSESASAQVWKVTSDGAATFVMEGKLETIEGEVTNPKGRLEIDPTDLTKTRGEISVDLYTLEMKTFDSQQKNEKQTVDARTWLEVADRIDDPEKQKSNRWSTFAVREIVKAHPSDLTKVAGAKRAAEVTAEGELLLHGRRTEHTVQLVAEIEYDGSTPKKLSLTTKEPFVVDLEAHQVQPRDTVGKALGWVNQLLRDKVSEESKVSISFIATPGKSAAR